MSQRSFLITTTLVIMVLVIGTVPIAWGGVAGQADPTQQQQTIDALIQERFTQTAVVQRQIDMTQTAQAATLFAPTLTAAFEATVDAAFNQALTATAAPQATATAHSVMKTVAHIAAALEAMASEKQAAIATWLGENQAALELILNQADFARLPPDDQTSVLLAALDAQERFTGLFIYDTGGRVLAATTPELVGSSIEDAPYFKASLTGPLTQPPYLVDPEGTLTMLAMRPIFDDTGQTVAILAGTIDLSLLDALLAEETTFERLNPVVGTAGMRPPVYLVEAATRRVLAPESFDAIAPLASDGIARALAGENGSGLYNDFKGEPVLGAYRWIAALNAALLVELPVEQASYLAANIPTPTPTPTITPTPLPASATPRPEIFPTNTVADVQMAEQVFERGRMFWIRHTRQIWVMVNVPPDNPGGDWFCYNDTYQEGEPEIDPNLVPPAGLYQPRRGFGKLWRNHPELQEGLGWAITPEFELTSHYTYIAGGYVQNNQYFPGPGEHRLTTLYNESISFFESDIRGDCVGGTWRMTGVP